MKRECTTPEKMLAFHTEIIVVAYCITELRLAEELNLHVSLILADALRSPFRIKGVGRLIVKRAPLLDMSSLLH